MTFRTLEAIETPPAAPAQEAPQQGHQRRFSKGEALWAAGEDPDMVWTVQQGHAVIEIGSADGGNAIVQVCTHGHTLCPSAAILGGPYPCRAVASADLVATAMPRTQFMRSFDSVPPTGRQALHQVAADFCQGHKERSHSTSSVKHRLAMLLERLHIQFQGAVLPFGGQELADMSGTRQETVSRVLGPWKASGVLRGRTGSVEVINSSHLQRHQD